MNQRLAPAVLSTLVISACATMPGRGAPAADARGTLASTAAFDHGCAVDRVRVIRADAAQVPNTSTVDLDVCGAVRRYKVFKGNQGDVPWQTWVDVTSLYPADVLPAALETSRD